MAEPSASVRETPTDPEAPDQTPHARALERFQLCTEAYSDQRDRELEDLRFIDQAGAQWPDDIRTSRNAQAAGGGFPAQPARPCLEFNLLRGPVQQVTNTARNARLSLSFAPDPSGQPQMPTAGAPTIDQRALAAAYDDIARAVQRDSRAHIARQWAFDRAAKCGFGAYRILTEYCSPTTRDQKIIYKRILNGASVYLDPFAEEPDWSDGTFAFVTADLSIARYRLKYPASKLANLSDQELTATGNDVPAWITSSGAGMSARVAEAWEVRETCERLLLLPDDTQVRESEIPKEVLAQVERDLKRPLPRRQIVTGRQVLWSLINGVEVLEGPQVWNGAYIPIIPVIGDEANVNGDRRWSGIVQFSRDAQRSYNYMRSAQVEGVGLAPRAPWTIADGQLEGYEAWWQHANTRNLPYLPYRLTTYDGRPAPPPQRNIAEPAIQAITIAAAAAKDDLHTTTNIPPVSLGQLDPHERSGVAIRALQGQAEVGTSGYLDNLASISMLYEGKVLKDLIPRIYDRPGRLVPAMDQAEKRRTVMVNIPFVEQNGQPQAVPPETPGAQLLDLKAAELSVTAVVGKDYQTRRAETADALATIMQAAPSLAPILAPYWLDELDFPGAKKLAAIAKKTLPPQFQDEESQGAGPSVEQLQGALGQAQQMIDLLSKELEAKTHVIETDQVKADQQVQLKQLELASQERIAALQARVDLLKAQQAAESAETRATVTAESGLERARLAGEQALERQLWGSVASSVQQLDQHAAARDQQATQIQADRDEAEAQREAQAAMAAQAPQGGPGAGPGGPQAGPGPAGG